MDPNASEVFYRVITKNGNGPAKVYNDDLLEKLDCPLLLCWGEYDPWIRPAAADKIQALKPSCTRISIDAGHCPHDEPAVEARAAAAFTASMGWTMWLTGGHVIEHMPVFGDHYPSRAYAYPPTFFIYDNTVTTALAHTTLT